MSVPSIVPAPVRALIEVFDEHLSELSFPDLDRDSLHAHAQAVAAALGELEAARARVECHRPPYEIGLSTANRILTSPANRLRASSANRILLSSANRIPVLA